MALLIHEDQVQVLRNVHNRISNGGACFQSVPAFDHQPPLVLSEQVRRAASWPSDFCNPETETWQSALLASWRHG